jgi:beta-barrel assembly-enhancing protease
MKHWIALTAIVSLGVAAIAISEHRKVEVPPGPAAILYLVADTEQELMRLPVHFTRISDSEEIAIGNRLADIYGVRVPENNSPIQTVENYLAQLGSRLTPHAHRKLPYKFHYVPDDSFINAFALPGGHVYVGRGLLALMESEDELASVIGHEIEHIDHSHCAERVQLEQALRKVPLGGLAAIPIRVFQVGYSKDQELDADREGTAMAVRAGYSANGAIRLFERFQRLEEASRRKARDPGEELSNVAYQTLQGYFRSHPLPSERIAQIQRLIATNRWPLVPERDLKVAYIFWTARAGNLFHDHKYAEAQALVLRSLRVQPDQQDALDILARAYFSQANFEDAAATYLRILEQGGNRDFAQYYAVALAAADRKNAAQEFDQWFKTVPARLDDLRSTRAGLSLLAGNPAAAENLREILSRERGTLPEQMGDLGWWYYLAGDYPPALRLLEDAVQQRPGESQWLTARAWVQIQNKTLEDAFQSLNAVYASGSPRPDRQMARAVAFWLSGQKDAALRDFDLAVEGQPEWKDPRWVRALYSPLVWDTVEKISAERERLRKLQQARLGGQ